MTVFIPWGVTNDNHSIFKQPKADEAALTVGPTSIFYLKMGGLEYESRILEIKATNAERFLPFGWIVGYYHSVNVNT